MELFQMLKVHHKEMKSMCWGRLFTRAWTSSTPMVALTRYLAKTDMSWHVLQILGCHKVFAQEASWDLKSGNKNHKWQRTTANINMMKDRPLYLNETERRNIIHYSIWAISIFGRCIVHFLWGWVYISLSRRARVLHSPLKKKTCIKEDTLFG